MSRRGPLITLASVLVLAVIFLWANTVAGKSATSTAATGTAPTATGTAPTATGTAPTATAKAPLSALYAGRSSGNEVAVAVAINGRKAAADLNSGPGRRDPAAGLGNRQQGHPDRG